MSKMPEKKTESAEKITPMMRQYFAIKSKYPDTLVFYRLGDFYELFFEDAKKASALLDLTLTRRGTHQGSPIPMAGVPYHSIDSYLAKLIRHGQSAVICEQVGEADSSRGMMQRKVSRILTPGTVTDEGIAPDRQENSIACICRGRTYFGFASLCLSSGRFTCAMAGQLQDLRLLLEKSGPSEIVYPENFPQEDAEKLLADFACRKTLPPWYFDLKTCYDLLCRQFATNSLIGFDVEDLEEGIRAAGALLAYVRDTQNVSLHHLRRIQREERSASVILDRCAQRNLELICNLRGERQGSLYAVLDKTCTPMGSRLLSQFITEPLRDNTILNQRLDLVQALLELNQPQELSALLSSCGDLQRAVVRTSLFTARPRDLVLIRTALQLLPALRELLSAEGQGSTVLAEFASTLTDLPEILDLLQRAVEAEPSGLLRDGGVIAPGFNEDLDRYRDLMSGSDESLRGIETRERERSGISTLKVAFNQVHGYYIEVSKAQSAHVPASYQRRQTLKNTERYITAELKELEDQALNAKTRALELEKQLYQDLLRQLTDHILELTALAARLAFLDVMSSFAECARELHYVRPELTETAAITIRGGRHPVIEVLSRRPFVSNDVDFQDKRMLIISGPNMGGKSTFMRQTALITIMARIGSFVPAEQASIGMIDRIFTRIGASDDLASGRSTFMVEMEETASILNNATDKSLVLMDEVGRGTSTLEGSSIARAIALFICRHINCLTLFSTHYAEITRLPEICPAAGNLCFRAEEINGHIVFLYQAEAGAQSYSYGVEVGRLAGLPSEVIVSAKKLMRQQKSAEESAAPPQQTAAEAEELQALEEVHRLEQQIQELQRRQEQMQSVLQEVRELNVNALTPLEALNRLAGLQQKLSALPPQAG